MKISEPLVTYNLKEINILNAIYLKDYQIELTFDDKKKRVVDFKEFLSKAKHPEIKKYLKKELFKQFRIDNGNLNWNDFDLIFPISDLYDGTIN